jgi:hypothetical protein
VAPFLRRADLHTDGGKRANACAAGTSVVIADCVAARRQVYQKTLPKTRFAGSMKSSPYEITLSVANNT